MNSPPQPDAPRVAPGSRRQIGLVTAAVLKLAARANGSESPPHVMTTLARHRRLFRGWIHFASTLMPRGTLDRADTELVILRVAHLCGSEYEWSHHAAIAATMGLSAEDVECIRREGAAANRWAPRQAALLHAADELHADQRISDATWAELTAFFDDVGAGPNAGVWETTPVARPEFKAKFAAKRIAAAKAEEHIGT